MKIGVLLIFCFGLHLWADRESVIYSPIGKRDPFRIPSSRSLNRDVASANRIERFSLEQLQLKAILKGMGKNRAMFEDPEGKTHILLEGAILGREKATVSRILMREVIVTVRTFNYLGNETLVEKVISLPTDEDDGPANRGPENLQVPNLRGEP